MEASWKFSGGVAKANLILSGTRILQRAWEFISQIKQSPRSISFAIRELPRFTILAFNSRSRPQDVLPNLESLVEFHPLKHRETHFAKLEGWEQADSSKAEKKGAAPMKEELKGKSAAPNVTHDSCFWAHVEEAALKLPELENGGEAKKEEIMQELREFEDYFMKLVNNYWLSPDAFCEKCEESSFMVWWRRYWEMLQREEPDSDRDSRPFIVFMSKGGYLNYINSAK